MELIQRCPHCKARLPAEARFCMQCGQPAAAGTPDDDARHSRLAAAVPPPLAEKVRAAAPLADERRMVTCLYLGVDGSSDLADQMGTEDWTAMINGAFDRMYAAIYRYEGTIARLLGDGLLAFFGAPVAHEDDPVRAMRAALEILEAAREYGREVEERFALGFAVCIGVDTGIVSVGPAGEDLRYDYSAMGGAVDLAARLQAAARPMTVLISEATRRFVEPFFNCADRGAIELFGFDAAVSTYEVVGPRAEPGSARGLTVAGLESPMVGRDAEMAILTELCEAVRAGLGRAVLVVGEPGLGKTRLIAEWRAAIEGEGLESSPLWAEGHCLSYGQGLAYHLLIDLVRSLAGVPEAAEEPEARGALLALIDKHFGEGALDVYPYLARLLMLDLEGEALEQVKRLDPQALQAHYASALRRLLESLAARQPLVLVLEDLHWADPSSTELLIQLLPLASTAPLMFCMVTRPNQDAPGWKLVTAAREVLGGGLTELALGALSEADSRQLVSNLLEIEALPDRTRILILKKAEGNPLFVEEVVRMLIDRGAVVERDGAWVAGAEIEEVEVPDNLQSLLLARIDRLPEEVKHTLRVASVIGRQFPVRVLEDVLQEDLPRQ
jgi:class 3 adenylate cyclase